MKSPLATFLATSVALVRAVDSSDECPTSVLLGIASNPHVAGCSSAAGFSSISSINELAPEKIKAICGSSACMKLMEDMATMGLGDCRIPDSEIHIQTDILDPFAKRCSDSGSTETSSTGSSGSSNNIREGSSSSETSGTPAIVVGCISVITLIVTTMLE